MCGIGGKISFTKKSISLSSLKAISEKVAHRGPDDSGYYLSKIRNVGLIHRRLSIIDLTSAGHQPMSFGGGRFWITYNGEIYNFQEEKKKLQKQGVRFHSKTDTEVILALYVKYGARCLEHLRGMFAFALYDDYKKTLFLARDRLGKKPLKYFYDGNVFIFASELKSILTQGEVKREPDWVSIHHFLTFGYTPSPMTGFRNIYKLEPAHYLFLDIKANKFRKVRYWKPDYSQKHGVGEEEWCDLILEKLEESTKLRMISDVPIGAFLSGGLDSSAVVAMMARLSPKPVRTFTIGFEDKRYDERKYAEKIAKLFHTDHEVLLASIKDVPEFLDGLVYQYEEPYANASSIVSYTISRLARKNVIVILNGDGGDENFAGYDRYIRFARDVRYNHIKPYLPMFLLTSLQKLAEASKDKFLLRMEKYAQKMTKDIAEVFVDYNTYLKTDQKSLLYREELQNGIFGINSYDIYKNKFLDSGADDPRDWALYADMTTYLPDDLLAKIDIATMSVALEARSPLLDQNFVELACQIPFDLKVKNHITKYIFKKALERIIPRESIYRNKMGFSVPIQEWFLGSLKPYAKSVLLSKNSISNKYFNDDYIKQLFASHSRQEDHGPALWALLVFEQWYKKFFK